MGNRQYEHIIWPDEKVADRFQELEGLLEFTTHEPRRQEISHELSCCALELVERKKERAQVGAQVEVQDGSPSHT